MHVCMYVCMYVRTYVRTYVRMYVCTVGHFSLAPLVKDLQFWTKMFETNILQSILLIGILFFLMAHANLSVSLIAYSNKNARATYAFIFLFAFFTRHYP